MYKKIVYGHRTSCAKKKKKKKRVYCEYGDYYAKKDIAALEKVAFFMQLSKIFSAEGAKYGISKIIGLNLSVL